MSNRRDNSRDRLSNVDASPIGHSFDLIDRRVIELWLGSQRSVGLPHFSPSRDLRGEAGEPKPGT